MFKYYYLLFLFFANFYIINTFDFKRVCYLRTDLSLEFPLKLIIENQYCTHIIIGFASVNENLIVNKDDDILFYKRCKSIINELNSETLIMLSIGGGGNYNGFHSAAYNDINRKKFANSVIKVVEEYGFDGIDIDWEFPSWANIYVWDKIKFNLLLKELRQTFTSYESTKSLTKNKLLLSVAVAAQLAIIERSYEMPDMMKYIDFLNLMSYDYHVFHWYWPFAGHNSPLFKREIDFGLFGTMNTKWSANYWNGLGADKSKIMVGIPTYARSFRLLFNWLIIPGTIAVANNGDLTYSQVCEFLRTNGTKVVTDEQSRVPFAYRDYNWVSFENEESAAQKVMWIKNNGFGGVMTFSLNADDFKYKCSQNIPFVIHSVIKSLSSQ